MIYAYVVGYGRSGSTLLDWTLGSHPDIKSVGEIDRLPESIMTNDLPIYCGCGKK